MRYKVLWMVYSAFQHFLADIFMHLFSNHSSIKRLLIFGAVVCIKLYVFNLIYIDINIFFWQYILGFFQKTSVVGVHGSYNRRLLESTL